MVTGTEILLGGKLVKETVMGSLKLLDDKNVKYIEKIMIASGVTGILLHIFDSYAAVYFVGATVVGCIAFVLPTWINNIWAFFKENTRRKKCQEFDEKEMFDILQNLCPVGRYILKRKDYHLPYDKDYNYFNGPDQVLPEEYWIDLIASGILLHRSAKTNFYTLTDIAYKVLNKHPLLLED